MRGEWNPTCAWVGAQWLRCQHASEEQAKPAAPRCMERCQCIILWSVMNDVEPSFLSSKIITCHQFMMTVCSPTFGLMDNPEGVVANGASLSEGVVWNWGRGTPGDRQIIVFFKKINSIAEQKRPMGMCKRHWLCSHSKKRLIRSYFILVWAQASCSGPIFTARGIPCCWTLLLLWTFLDVLWTQLLWGKMSKNKIR